MRSAWRISATPAPHSSRYRRFRRATSRGPRRANGSILAKIAFEKYFLRKVRTGSLTPVYETYVMKAIGIVSLKQTRATEAGETCYEQLDAHRSA